MNSARSADEATSATAFFHGFPVSSWTISPNSRSRAATSSPRVPGPLRGAAPAAGPRRRRPPRRHRQRGPRPRLGPARPAQARGRRWGSAFRRWTLNSPRPASALRHPRANGEHVQGSSTSQHEGHEGHEGIEGHEGTKGTKGTKQGVKTPANSRKHRHFESATRSAFIDFVAFVTFVDFVRSRTTRAIDAASRP